MTENIKRIIKDAKEERTVNYYGFLTKLIKEAVMNDIELLRFSPEKEKDSLPGDMTLVENFCLENELAYYINKGTAYVYISTEKDFTCDCIRNKVETYKRKNLLKTITAVTIYLAVCGVIYIFF